MLRKAVGKTLDYFFGVGDKNDLYNTGKKYSWTLQNKDIRKIVEESLNSDKITKIIVRNITNISQTAIVYYAITEKNYLFFLALPILETLRIFSLFADYKNKKRFLKNRDKELENLFHPEETEENRNTTNPHSDINDADWWKG